VQSAAKEAKSAADTQIESARPNSTQPASGGESRTYSWRALPMANGAKSAHGV